MNDSVFLFRAGWRAAVEFVDKHGRLTAHSVVKLFNGMEGERAFRQAANDKLGNIEESLPIEESEQRLMNLLSHALGVRHPAVEDLATLIFARKERDRLRKQLEEQKHDQA